jgi:hypothetical protein
MLDFHEWLVFCEARRDPVSQSVVQSYERLFRQELERVIRRTENPKLRVKLLEMLDCPITDSRGGCRGFTEYIVSALIKAGVHERFDLEGTLAYVVQQMLLDRTEHGQRLTVFRGFEERPDYVTGNPLQVRFLKSLHYSLLNIRKGKIPRLANVASFRSREGGALTRNPAGEAIPSRPSTDSELAELIDDISDLLRRKETSIGLPLVDLFRAMMAGSKATEVRRRFGDRKSRRAKAVILQVVRDYAETSKNFALLNLLRRRASQRDLAGGRSANPNSPRSGLAKR